MSFPTQGNTHPLEMLKSASRSLFQICSIIKTDENKNVYAVMTNFRECIWYMKSDFIMSCLAGMEKTALFMMEYKDVDMAWIDQFMDFLIHAVEHGIDKYKNSKTGKTVEMVLFPVTLFNNDDKE